MFRKKPTAPSSLPEKTRLYETRLTRALRIGTPGGRYQALALLVHDMEADIAARARKLDTDEERRMMRAIMGMTAGIPLAAAAAALCGMPLALLVLIPGIMGSGVYTNITNHQKRDAFLAENAACLPKISAIHTAAREAQDDILAHQAAALATSPQYAALVNTCPRLRTHFALAQQEDKTNQQKTGRGHTPRPPRP